jgi:GST-like protein
MPAIVDPDGPGGEPISIFESGAILLYLADKTGRFLPRDARARWSAVEWLMFQMGGVGPMFGQAGHFTRYAPEKIAYAIERYANESRRLCGVLDKRLTDRDFLAGEYSIADMATFPWVHAIAERIDAAEMPRLTAWLERLRARPAVQRGLAVMNDIRRPAEMSAEQRSILFGAKQFERR